jgi:hypothetical protein
MIGVDQTAIECFKQAGQRGLGEGYNRRADFYIEKTNLAGSQALLAKCC